MGLVASEPSAHKCALRTFTVRHNALSRRDADNDTIPASAFFSALNKEHPPRNGHPIRFFSAPSARRPAPAEASDAPPMNQASDDEKSGRCCAHPEHPRAAAVFHGAGTAGRRLIRRRDETRVMDEHSKRRPAMRCPASSINSNKLATRTLCRRRNPIDRRPREPSGASRHSARPRKYCVSYGTP